MLLYHIEEIKQCFNQNISKFRNFYKIQSKWKGAKCLWQIGYWE